MAEHLISIEDAQKDLLSCATFLAENITSSDGYAKAMSQIVLRYLAKKEVDFAAELADSVDDPFVRDKLLSRVAEKCAELDDDEYGFQLIEAIDDYGTKSMARERLALVKSSQGETEKALEIVDVLEHPDNAFADIALHQAMDGEAERALKTLDRIDFPLARVNALQNIARFHREKGNPDKATELLEMAVEAAGEIEYQEEKIRAFLDIANQFVEAGLPEKAIGVLENAKIFCERIEGVHRDGLFARIAQGFLRAGNMELADQTLDLVGDKTQTASCMVGFADHFWETGERDEAVETLEEAHAILKSQRDREIRDTRARLKLLGTVAVQFAKFEKPDRAMEIAQENIDELEQYSALSQIAQINVLLGKDELARQALNAISEDSSRMFALVGMSDVKNQLGQKEEALELLAEASALCETVPQLVSRSAAYNEFARRFHDFGETEKSRKFLHENLRNIAEIRDETNRSILLAELSDLYQKYDFTLSEEETNILRELVRKSEW